METSQLSCWPWIQLKFWNKTKFKLLRSSDSPLNGSKEVHLFISTHHHPPALPSSSFSSFQFCTAQVEASISVLWGLSWVLLYIESSSYSCSLTSQQVPSKWLGCGSYIELKSIKYSESSMPSDIRNFIWGFCLIAINNYNLKNVLSM